MVVFQADANRSKLSRPEIYRLVNDYIEVHGGYLGDFSYRTHHEFYPYYCDLDIDTDSYTGTTRERFLQILSQANGINQAKIVRGILKKYPVSFFSEDVREFKQTLHDEFVIVACRLEKVNETGVEGKIKNLIFASNGPKPRIVLRDATTNDLEIVENAEYCLVYEDEIPEDGLSWATLIKWWRGQSRLVDEEDSRQVARSLNRRLLDGQNEPERLLFNSYYGLLSSEYNDSFPALIPQVYLHYDPYTLSSLGKNTVLARQRMDFLLLLPNRICVVLEVDGQQHYSFDGRPSPPLYAEMVREDRKLRLKGYEVYRFGGQEFTNQEEAKHHLEEFFRALFKRHNLQ